MAIITKFLKGAASAPLVHVGGHKVVAENLLDFSQPDFDVAGDDEVQAIIVPAGAVVTEVRFETLEAEGSVAVGTIGDIAAPDGWEAIWDLNSLDGLTKGDGTYSTNGVFYEEETTIDIVPAVALDTAVLYISVEYYIRELY